MTRIPYPSPEREAAALVAMERSLSRVLMDLPGATASAASLQRTRIGLCGCHHLLNEHDLDRKKTHPCSISLCACEDFVLVAHVVPLAGHVILSYQEQDAE